MKVLGSIAVIAISWLVTSLALMLGVGILHAWYDTIPAMPFVVAAKLAAVLAAYAILGGVLKGIVESEYK